MFKTYLIIIILFYIKSDIVYFNCEVTPCIEKIIRLNNEIIVEYCLSQGLLNDSVYYKANDKILIKQYWKYGELRYEEVINGHLADEIKFDFYQTVINVENSKLNNETYYVIVKNISNLNNFMCYGAKLNIKNDTIFIYPVPPNNEIKLFADYALNKKKILIFEN